MIPAKLLSKDVYTVSTQHCMQMIINKIWFAVTFLKIVVYDEQ